MIYTSLGQINIAVVKRLCFLVKFKFLQTAIFSLVFGKNSTGNNDTNGKVGKHGTFSTLGFEMGFGA